MALKMERAARGLVWVAMAAAMSLLCDAPVNAGPGPAAAASEFKVAVE
jgi:hypothetical protein